MILISSSIYELTTNYVINWVDFFNKKYLRVNIEDNYILRFKINKIEIVNNALKSSNYLCEFKSFWHRRGNIIYKTRGIPNDNPIIIKQDEVVNEFINHLLVKKNSIGNFHTSEPNKLIVLSVAKNVGLKIPKSFIIETKNELRNLVKKEKSLITKTINGSSVFKFSNKTGIIYTNKISNEELEGINSFFFPSLIQIEIEKKYELRVFFLDDKFWTMAIFSQKDEQTKGDYRRYNQEKENRNVPYALPKDIEKKLKQLMGILGLNTGSIDLIVSLKNEYYFLEVNPIGQFGNVSFNCNYYLEKEVAKVLCK